MDLRPLVLFAGGDPVVATGADKIAECWAYDLSLKQLVYWTGKNYSSKQPYEFQRTDIQRYFVDGGSGWI
jgi:hypothetical protein